MLLLVSGCAMRHDDGSVDSLVMAYGSEDVSFFGLGWVKQYRDGEVSTTTSGLTASTRPSMRVSFDILGTRKVLMVPVEGKAVEVE